MPLKQLKITVGDKELMASFIDSKTTRDFIAILPLNLRMDDIRKREKYASLSAVLAKEGDVKTTYKTGDISYWLGGGIAVFYDHDGREVQAGLIVLARLESGIETFNVPDSVLVKFEAVEKQ